MEIEVKSNAVFNLPIEERMIGGIDPVELGEAVMTSYKMVIVDLSTGEEVIFPDKKKHLRRKMKNNQHGK